MLHKSMTIADALKSTIKGQVITADDAKYDTARSVFYGGIDRHPAAIVRVADANDVTQVVSIARESGAELAIRAGGHSVAGHSASEGGIVLDVSLMKGLEFDLEARTAWAEAGLTAGEYTIAAAEHGLVTGFGDTASVGIAGLTLGGGIGFLVRKFGLTIDDLLAAEIVTADGEILQIDAENHPDLFWAIRGGGGNFGMVTRFKFRLHELEQVVGGILILPASPEILRGFVEASKAAPEELSSIVNVMVAPPMPFIAEEHHGKLITFALMVYAGDIANGEQVYAPFRALAEPLADMIRPMTYPEIYMPDEEGYHPLAVGRTLFMDTLGQNEADVIFQYLDSSDAMMAVAQIRVLGGAMARVPADATAFAHRNRKIMANVAALFTNPDEAAKHEIWANDFMAALRKGEDGAYVNFLAEEGEARLREAYPAETWKRLAAVKAHYDPTNFFHKNHNITPDVE